MRPVVKKPKAKRYLFIGGPRDRMHIRVDHPERVFAFTELVVDTESSNSLCPASYVTNRYVYHLESLEVDDVIAEAYIYDDLWKDRIKLFAHLLGNYGKPKKYPRRNRPKIPMDMMYNRVPSPAAPYQVILDPNHCSKITIIS